MQPLGALPKVGDRFAGKYVVEALLGQGGMGCVFAARHELLEQRVAIKVLAPNAVGNGDAVARLVNEARAAARIESEHVARPIDVGLLEDGSPFIVMEYLEGQDLAALVAERGPLPIGEAVDYVLQVLDALAQAHAAGIVHRDLKPSNVFLARKKDLSLVAKVVDFGICKLQSVGPEAVQTATQAIMGSPLYMSPEQAMSTKSVDARTDIWSMGVILYELLTGRSAFEAATYGQVFARIFEASFPPASSLRADIPPALEAVIARCLQREPAARFASAVELGLAVAPFGTGRRAVNVERLRAQVAPDSAHVALPAPAVVTGPRAAPAPENVVARTGGAWGSTASRSAGGTPRRKGLWLVAACGVVLLGVGAATVWRVMHRAPEAEANTLVSASGSVPSSSQAAASAPEAEVSAAPALAAAPPLESPSGAPSEAPSAVAAATSVAPLPAKPADKAQKIRHPVNKASSTNEPSLESSRK